MRQTPKCNGNLSSNGTIALLSGKENRSDCDALAPPSRLIFFTVILKVTYHI